MLDALHLPLGIQFQFQCSIERKWRQKWGCGGNFLPTKQPPSDHVILDHFIPLHQAMVATNQPTSDHVISDNFIPPNQPTSIRSCHLGSFHSSPPTNGCNQPTQQPTSDLIISNHFKLCNSSDFFPDAFPIPIRLHSQAEAKQLKCSFMSRVLTVMFWDPQCTAAPYDPCLDQGYWLQWE